MLLDYYCLFFKIRSCARLQVHVHVHVPTKLAHYYEHVQCIYIWLVISVLSITCVLIHVHVLFMSYLQQLIGCTLNFFSQQDSENSYIAEDECDSLPTAGLDSTDDNSTPYTIPVEQLYQEQNKGQRIVSGTQLIDFCKKFFNDRFGFIYLTKCICI